jgi:hypothetical protein
MTPGWPKRLTFVLLFIPALVAWAVLLTVSVVLGLISRVAFNDANRLSAPVYELSCAVIDWMAASVDILDALIARARRITRTGGDE